MEGWYYRLTLPDDGISFAFIISIEDPGRRPPSDIRLACIQIVGPDDGYLVQADRDDTKFWAWKHQQGLGCAFSFQSHIDVSDARMKTALAKDEWLSSVESGFQILPNHLLGRIRGHDGSLGGVLEGQGRPGTCHFDFAVEPVCGWGGTDEEDQKSTGGWLASFAVFEPHWQVTMADGRASGEVVWQNKSYAFQNAPFYAEKNWGAALPIKWYWTQVRARLCLVVNGLASSLTGGRKCNAFVGHDQLSVTAGGGIRTIPFGRREALGMVSVHYNGRFYEGVPWSGAMQWRAGWGFWELKGNSTYGDSPFEAIVSYRCDPTKNPGLVFRAPTPDDGMVNFCRDTFDASTTLTLWELDWDRTERRFKRKPGPPLIDGAKSVHGGAEIGGGPWWDEWKGGSRLKQPVKFLLQVPVRIESHFGPMLQRHV